jgi:predicted transcriptional regulator
MNKAVPDRSIFEPAHDAEEEKALAEAEAEIAAGKFVSHDAVRRWLLSWGTAEELPPPKCGE